MKEWMLTDRELDNLMKQLGWLRHWDDVKEQFRTIANAQAKKIVEEIQNQMQYNLSALAYIEFTESPYWKQLRKEVGL